MASADALVAPATYNARYAAQGYSVLSQQTFRDAANNSIYQTVWVREGFSTAKQHTLI